jgi:hypothetical protein
MAKYDVALPDKVKQVSKRQGKGLKGILFLQDNAALHKVDIMHQKLADLHFEVVKHLAHSSDWPLQTTASFLTSREDTFEH